MEKTLIQTLRKGTIPLDLRNLAEKENISVHKLADDILAGVSVVLGYRTGRGPVIVGNGVRTKINANIGASTLCSSIEEEEKKLASALKAGADAIMDLSLADNLRDIRKLMLAESTVPVGTVPVYEAATRARLDRGAVINLDGEEFLDIIRGQLEEGVDFLTVHAGVIKEIISNYTGEKRIEGIVSRGGAITAAYIRQSGRENPLYEHYDRLLDMAEKYDAVLSLGDGLRPGAIGDASDYFEVSEQEILGDLQKRALERGVMSMIEGPGHVPLHRVEESVRRIKKLTNQAPLYLLGPIVTDIAPGYDHITAAIGASVAGMSGADFLCYVTPSEHLGLPDEQDVYDGVMAFRIAGHAADIAKGIPGAARWDDELSRARRSLDWDRQIALSVDPEKAARVRKERSGDGACTMCGDCCVFLVLKDKLECEDSEEA
ncbi:MAG TPA: phosphomethylpyrimidine synthase ThiC [Thermodesulfobacteriaceae bacterium]|nr:phosphomethylpyrimidine synthase ThiC [Thermodesulfobacteriaceae bacterium]